MQTPQTILGHVKAEPFRPFRLHLASGRTFEVRHPEPIKVLRSCVLLFKPARETWDVPEEGDTVSLMLIESISHLESPVA